MTAPAARRACDRGPRRRATSRFGFRLSAAVVAGLAVMLLSAPAPAKDMTWRRCVLSTIPDDWIVTDNRAHSPDGRVAIQISEVSNGRTFINFQRAFGVTALPVRTPGLLRVLSTRVGHRTRYFAVTDTDRACVGQVTSTRDDRNAEAERIARTVRRLRR